MSWRSSWGGSPISPPTTRRAVLAALTAEEGLGALEPVATNPGVRTTLLELLSDPSAPPEARASACYVLGSYQRSKQPVRVLAERLADRDEEPAVRVEAARAMANLGGPKALEALVQVVEDGDERAALRARVAEALGSTLDPSAVPPLLAVLADRSVDPQVRASCAQALAYQGGRGVGQALFAAVEEFDARLRFWSLFALGEIAGTRDAPPRT